MYIIFLSTSNLCSYLLFIIDEYEYLSALKFIIRVLTSYKDSVHSKQLIQTTCLSQNKYMNM